jgi:hypothetical protein
MCAQARPSAEVRRERDLVTTVTFGKLEDACHSEGKWVAHGMADLVKSEGCAALGELNLTSQRVRGSHVAHHQPRCLHASALERGN